MPTAWPHALVLTLACLAAGCAHRFQEPTLVHEIEVPKRWRTGCGSALETDISPIGRYVGAYDRGWWIAVQRYAEDIDFDDPSPLVMSGWPEEAGGGDAGYVAARDRIEQLIRLFGKQRVSEYLQAFRIPEEPEQ